MYRKREFLYMLHPICIKITDIGRRPCRRSSGSSGRHLMGGWCQGAPVARSVRSKGVAAKLLLMRPLTPEILYKSTLLQPSQQQGCEGKMIQVRVRIVANIYFITAGISNGHDGT